MFPKVFIAIPLRRLRPDYGPHQNYSRIFELSDVLDNVLIAVLVGYVAVVSEVPK
jgi:hypothetical protein